MTQAERVDLKDFFERWLNEVDKRYEQRFQDQEKAIRVAVEAHDRLVKFGFAVLGVLELALHFFR